MSEYEIYSYDAFRKRIHDDIRKVENAKLSLFDKERLNEYFTAVRRERKNLSDNIFESELLELMGVTADGVPTLAGVMTFSKYPQGYFPQLCITAVVVPGTEIGELGDNGERFIDNQRITGSIPEMLEDAVDFVRRNSRTQTIINDDGQRKDKYEYPMKAVREAILNALVHRDYSIHTENVPIRIEMYRFKTESMSGKTDIKAGVLDFCEIPRTRAELQQLTGFSRFYMMTSIVNPLIESGKLKMTIPDKPKSKYQKYFKA
ncbi:MAG: hypothetical protein PHV32_04790 [Eubacteriales bacterium]|nr:hypothetical protein [Eubacteriales bacterium]